jgi:hypothetical protein
VIDVAAQIIVVARERAAEDDEWSIGLLLESVGDVAVAAKAARKALGDVIAEYRPSAGWDWEEAVGGAPSVGEWGVARTPAGVRLTVTECDEFHVVLPMLVEAFERHGIAGSIRVDEPSRPASLPVHADILICHVRVRGQRVRRDHEPWVYSWEAEAGALGEAVGQAVAWSRRPGFVTQSLSASGVYNIAVGHDEDVVDRIVDSVLLDRQSSQFRAGEPAAFRAVGSSIVGGVALVTGGSRLTATGWQSERAELTTFLREHADLFVYGYVRRGWAVQSAVGGDDLTDWPRRQDSQFATAGFTSKSFDDVLVRDAFAIQLLGPGHAEHIPTTAAWQRARVGRSSVLLEHVTPGAWFDQPFWPRTVLEERYLNPRPPLPGPPPVLVDARADFAPLLFTRGNLDRAGFETRNPYRRAAT